MSGISIILLLKGAYSFHTPFFKLVRLIKYGVSIGEGNILSRADIILHAIFIVYLKFAGRKFDITKKKHLTFLLQFVSSQVFIDR